MNVSSHASTRADRVMDHALSRVRLRTLVSPSRGVSILQFFLACDADIHHRRTRTSTRLCMACPAKRPVWSFSHPGPVTSSASSSTFSSSNPSTERAETKSSSSPPGSAKFPPKNVFQGSSSRPSSPPSACSGSPWPRAPTAPVSSPSCQVSPWVWA